MMQVPERRAHRISIAQILGMEDIVRVQDPEIQTTDGADPRYYIRPWVDTFDESGSPCRKQQRIYLGRVAETKKRDAIKRKNEAMAKINKSQHVLQAQLNFGEFLDHYLREYVRKADNLASSTQSKYEVHIKNHIRPAFGGMMLSEITTRVLDGWMAAKTATLSWATRMDLRNIVCGIFTKAEDWGLWKEKNPALRVSVGRKRAVREQRKLTVEQTRLLLEALPHDVRMICMVALFCTLRISEVMGLMWKHVDFERGLIKVRQRYYRGDLDERTKSERSSRNVALGSLAGDLKLMYPGDGNGDEFVFWVSTHGGRRSTRDDRSIHQHFLRPAAKNLKLYWIGFGFHSFRREAVTAHGLTVGPLQAARMAGHSRVDMAAHYTLEDMAAQDRAVRDFQHKILGGKMQ